MSEPHAEPLVASCPTLSTDRSHSQFTNVNFVEFLNSDPRLNFVLDLKGNVLASHPAGSLAFCNSALQRSTHIHSYIIGAFTQGRAETHHEEDRFAQWVIGRTTHSRSRPSKVFFGALWTVALLPDNWAVISGIDLAHCDWDSSSNHTDLSNASLSQDDALLGSPPGISSQLSSGPDTDVKPYRTPRSLRTPAGEIWPPAGLGDSAHVSWIREFDWASTSLGPTENWPPLLKQACEMMLANPEPATVFWGRDLILIYNEAYIALAGNKHPDMMGGSARVHWKEVWDQYDPLFDQMFLDGKPFTQDKTQLFIHRSGYLEEGYFNMRVVPLIDDDGSVVGFYEPVSEVTKQTLSERRMYMLLKLSERTSSETSLRGLWRRLLESLGDHPSDIHFAVLYHLHPSTRPGSTLRYDLEGAIGSGLEARGFPQELDIHASGADDIVTSLRRAHESGASVLLTTSDGSLSPSILQKLEAAGMTEAPRACIVCPLSSSVDDSVDALLVLGISPRRSYDEDYELFINLLIRQVESTITSVKMVEKEKEQLRQQALYDSELKFKKFAENAQVGIFSFDPLGNITFCNESWLELSGHDRNDMSAMSWTHDVHPENAAEIKGYWDKLVNLEGPQTFEVQYKKPWRPANLNDESISLDRTWVVASAYAEVSDEGELTAILGCVTDISSFKWVDQLQSHRLSEALELKRQQENFLDITSHEMRNPLNAILHCAAELIETLPGLAETAPTPERSMILRGCLEASRTIVYCGRHQKRIIDDVLTLSKLDSNLLSITPVETRPLDVVGEVLRVFDTEIRTSSIKTKTELAPSYTALQIETLLVDPHRLLQILINLVANAVKFTKGESLRGLHVVVGAHETEPISSEDGVRYVPSGRRPADPTIHPDWGTGEVVFLHFSVQDTGPGMSREEADLLFNRFSQASPRTHVQYGGSGLGLFISRELAELHGGRIGISSELGYGSTFDFYVKGRRPMRSETQNAPNNTPPIIYLPQRPVPKTRLSAEPLTPILFPSKVARRPSRTPSWPLDVHVLIVEDNLINQKILAKLIQKQGWATSVANHGEEALAEINKSTWRQSPVAGCLRAETKLDIVLADIEMPVMDGKDFVRHVRRLQDEGVLARHIPVIAVTGNARNEQIRQAEECGFDEVVSKPYREEDIIAIVLKYTNRADT